MSKFLDCWIKSRTSLLRILLFLPLVWGFFILCGSQSFALAADPSQDWLVQAPFLIATGLTQQTVPAVEGDIVIYKSGTDLFGINIAGNAGSQLLAKNLSTFLNNLDIKSKRAIYQTNDGVRKFCSKDLSAEPWSSQPPLNCVAATTGYGISATNDGLGVYYNGSYGLSGSGGIFFVDFNTGTYSNIDSNMYTSHPYVTSTGPIWTKWQSWQGMYYSNVIMQGSVYLSGPGCEMNTSRDYARVAGGHVMYDRKISIGNWDLVAYMGDPYSQNSTSRCAETVIVGGAGDQKDAEVVSYRDEHDQIHDLIVWEDSRNGNFDIYMKDLATSQEVAICQDAGDQINPAITLSADGRPFIVWQDMRSGNWDIYGTRAVTAKSVAEKYRPELRMTLGENFEPMPVEQFLSAPETFLKKRDDSSFNQIINPTAAILAQYDAARDVYYIDLQGDSIAAGGGNPSRKIDHGKVKTDYAKPYQTKRDDPANPIPRTIYARVISRPGGNENSFIQYWLCYYANDHAEMFHEGDWEVVQVDLDGNLKPYRVDYSQHGYGQWRNWDGPGSVEKSGSFPDQPVVYIGVGSHANYFTANAKHAIKWQDRSIPYVWDDASGSGNVLNNPDVSESIYTQVKVIPETDQVVTGSEFEWLKFMGQWGEYTNAYVEVPLHEDLPGFRDGPDNPPVQDRWTNAFAWNDNNCDGCQDEQAQGTDTGVTALSPVDIHLYDSQGRHTGKNANGGIDQQIPNSEYLEYPTLHRKSIIIHGSDINQGYRFEATGNGTGPADFIVTAPDHPGGTVDTLNYNAIQVNPATRVTMNLNASKTYAMTIDTDGNGTNVSQKSPDTTTTNSVDFTPPAQVSDLATVATSAGSATLSFTAPGDDGNTGTATAYDLRYSTAAITDQYWQDAVPVSNLPAPLLAGSSQTITVSGLSPGTTYYFALKAMDEAALFSSLSNVASGTTTIPRLSWSKQRIYWANWTDYQNRQLSIDYRLSNTGTGVAIAATVQASLCSPGSVYVTTPLLLTVGNLNPGISRTVTLKYFVPTTVGSFTTTTYATCRDDIGSTYWFPGPMP